MQPKCPSPVDFLNYLRFVHERPLEEIRSEPNLQFQEILDSKWARTPFKVQPAQINAESAHNHIAGSLWLSLSTCLPANILSKFNHRLAVGALDHMSVNALCAISAEGHLAILINSGLMTLFNKLSKIFTATSTPNSIVYCNRTGLGPLDAITLRGWMTEVCEHYKKTGKPLGPQIHLEGSAEFSHSIQLGLWEMFVLTHELGHILCGHLDENKFLIPNPSFGMVQTLEEGRHHQMEIDADTIGFQLLRKYASTEPLFRCSSDPNDERQLLASMTTLFDMLFMLGARESQSHPHPLNRLCHIVAAVYGEDIADTLFRSYDEPRLLDELMSKPLHAKTDLLEEHSR